jgi:Ser/Thr protein kinase RdoA (MazF antagonist)
MNAENDRALSPVLSVLGISASHRLGQGGEAVVYALDADRVARIHRRGTRLAQVEARSALLAELADSADRVPFAIPEVLETRQIHGHSVTIEPRLPGSCLQDALAASRGAGRAALVRSYLEAAAQIGALEIGRSWCGDLCRADAVRTETPRTYLAERAASSLRQAGREFQAIDARALADALPDPSRVSVVHLDAFPGNMLTDGRRVTAVLDFGVFSIRGDPQLDVLQAAVYLQAPMTPNASEGDRELARAWLGERELEPYLEAAERWTAAFWSQWHDDARLHRWCRSILLDT